MKTEILGQQNECKDEEDEYEDDNIPLTVLIEISSLKVNEVIDIDSGLKTDDNWEEVLLERNQPPQKEQTDKEQECEEYSSLSGSDNGQCVRIY